MRADDWCSTGACRALEAPCLCTRIERALEVIERHGWTRQKLSQVARVMESIARTSVPGQAGANPVTNIVALTPLLDTQPMALRQAID